LLKDYRNHKQLKLEGVGRINFIKGPNASGKSNAMEALMRLNSFNGDRDNIIRFGKDCAIIKAEVEKGNNLFEYRFVAQKENEDVRIERRCPQGPLPIVSLGLGEDNFFNGGPSARRRFLDNAISLLKEKHKKNTIEYQKIVKQKNDLLKRGKTEETLLWSFNKQLVERAASIIKERLKYLSEVEEGVALVYKRLSGGRTEGVSLRYASKTNTDNIAESLLSQLEERKRLEEQTGFCVVVSHRDAVPLNINEIDVATLGSRGEKKSACLALKIAQVEDLRKKKIKPLLILDDALSELDIERRQLLLGVICGCEQVFITSTDDLGLSMNGEIRKYELPH